MRFRVILTSMGILGASVLLATPHSSWVKDSRARNLRFDSSAARGAIDICEIQAWSNDPCSPQALPQFSY